MIHVVGAEILPSSTYAVEVIGCEGDPPAPSNTCSGPVTVTTRRAGDIAPVFQDPAAGRTQPNAIDVVGAVNNFKKAVGAPKHIEAQVQPNVLNLKRDVDALDIQAIVANQKLGAYPYSGPCPCPSTVTCNATECTNGQACNGGMCMKKCVGGINDGMPCTTTWDCNYCGGGVAEGFRCASPDGCPQGGVCGKYCTAGTLNEPCLYDTECNLEGTCNLATGLCASGPVGEPCEAHSCILFGTCTLGFAECDSGYCHDRCGRCTP